MRSKLDSVDQIAIQRVDELIKSIPADEAVAIRNYPDIKKQIKVHEINGGVKTGVCYKGKKCKCTEESETKEPITTRVRTSSRTNQNLCTVKSCPQAALDLNIENVILWANDTLQEVIEDIPAGTGRAST